MRTVALVAAAGAGERLSAGLPKAFVDLRGRPILDHTIRGLMTSGVVDSIVASVPHSHLSAARALGKAVYVSGGADRRQSVALALAAAGPADFVLVHDAARALTPPSVIARVVAALHAGHEAVVPAIPVIDTIKSVGDDGSVLSTPARAGLRAVQTPQGFRADLLRRAYNEMTDGEFTDDASLVEAIGARVHVVGGDPAAFKITAPMDLLLAEALLDRGVIPSGRAADQ